MVGLRYLLATLLVAHSYAFSVDLEIVSKLFLPYTYTPNPIFEPLQDAAEQMAYDTETRLLYSVGHTNIHVINISDVTNLQVLFHLSQENVDVTDVEICGGFVFVANVNRTKREDGFVDVYRVYNAETKTLDHVQRIIVGDLPDMIHPTSDCSKVVVVLEAEPYDDDATQRLIDNPGAVIIVSFSGTPTDTYSIKRLDFKAFDSRLAELEESGVRQVYKEHNNTFSNDVEPEYIAFNKEETKAYVSLQENNAIAVVDMTTETIENVYGLSFKNWSQYRIDVSDKDNGIILRPRHVYGMYQPDSIKVYRHQGVDYVISANEGDSKDYKYFSEEARVDDYGLSSFYESNDTVRSLLDTKPQLGRLKVTTMAGFNSSTNKFDRLYSYGGRSFSIWRADTMTQVYDSGDELAQKISLLSPAFFNSNMSPTEAIAASMDTRSDDKGLETENVVLGHFGDITLVFIGNERPGIVAVYSIDGRLPEIRPRFETLLSDIPRTNETWQTLYDQRALSMIDCEDMRFIPAEKSPNGKPLLLVSGSASGTITVVQINMKDLDDEPNNLNGASGVSRFSGFLFLTMTAFVLTTTRLEL